MKTSLSILVQKTAEKTSHQFKEASWQGETLYWELPDKTVHQMTLVFTYTPARGKRSTTARPKLNGMRWKVWKSRLQPIPSMNAVAHCALFQQKQLFFHMLKTSLVSELPKRQPLLAQFERQRLKTFSQKQMTTELNHAAGPENSIRGGASRALHASTKLLCLQCYSMSDNNFPLLSCPPLMPDLGFPKPMSRSLSFKRPLIPTAAPCLASLIYQKADHLSYFVQSPSCV